MASSLNKFSAKMYESIQYFLLNFLRTPDSLNCKSIVKINIVGSKSFFGRWQQSKVFDNY